LTDDLVRTPNQTSSSIAHAQFLHHTGAAASNTHELDLLDLQEDRRRVHSERKLLERLERQQDDADFMDLDAELGHTDAAEDKENEAVVAAAAEADDGGDPLLELSGKQVFSFEKFAVREMKKIRKREDMDVDEQQQRVGTPKKARGLDFSSSSHKSGINTPTSKRRGGQSVPVTPTGQLSTSKAKTPKSAAKAQMDSELNTPVGRRGKKLQTEEQEEQGVGMRLRNRMVTRTPDVKFANRRQIASVVELSDSENDEDDLEDDEDDEERDDQDMDEDDEDHEQQGHANLEEQQQAEIRQAHAAAASLDDLDDGGEVANVDEYFSIKKKAQQTSNNTLSKLPTLSHQDYIDALTAAPRKHAEQKNLLVTLTAMNFNQWMFELSEGFNLLLYGYGSKEKLINKFIQERCLDSPVITLKGYLPKLNPVKDLLSKILMMVVKRESVKSAGSLPNQIATVASYLSNPAREYDHIYLVIHNLDGPYLRNEKSQNLLASLIASAPLGTIRLIASIDHINAPLLWDRAVADQYRWLWKDATTFEPYSNETEHASVMMVQSNQRTSAEGAKHVLASLNSNAQKMFKLLAEHQMEVAKSDERPKRKSQKRSNIDDEDADEENAGRGGGDSDNEDGDGDSGGSAAKNGLALTMFYQLCVGDLIATNMEVFKTQLGEFRDHKLIVSRRASDGEETLYIPFNADALQELVDFVSNK
jgi:origin recognition complex subunit 2